MKQPQKVVMTIQIISALCLKGSFQLEDAWEINFGHNNEYSFIRGGFGSRIERIFVFQSLSFNVVDAKYQVTSFTDYKAHFVEVHG